MNRLRSFVEWLDREWLRFLFWFVAGLFLIPIALSTLSSGVNLDRFYAGLHPAGMSVMTVLLVIAPYLFYLIFRIVRHLRQGGEIELF